MKKKKVMGRPKKPQKTLRKRVCFTLSPRAVNLLKYMTHHKVMGLSKSALIEMAIIQLAIKQIPTLETMGGSARGAAQ